MFKIIKTFYCDFRHVECSFTLHHSVMLPNSLHNCKWTEIHLSSLQTKVCTRVSELWSIHPLHPFTHTHTHICVISSMTHSNPQFAEVEVSHRTAAAHHNRKINHNTQTHFLSGLWKVCEWGTKARSGAIKKKKNIHIHVTWTSSFILQLVLKTSDKLHDGIKWWG